MKQQKYTGNLHCLQRAWQGTEVIADQSAIEYVRTFLQAKPGELSTAEKDC